MPIVVLHDDAEREVHEAVDYIEQNRPYYGTLFFDAFEAVLARLLEHPKAGRRLRGDVRRWVMRAWKYSIIYSIETDGIFVIAVAHQSRRSNYWRHRLKRP